MSILKHSLSKAAMALMLSATVFVISCDHDKPSKSTVDDFSVSTGEPAGTAQHDLRLTPRSADLSRIGEQLVVKADGGVPPYTWSLSNPGGGTIDVLGYSEVRFTASTLGYNEVICTDSLGHRAVVPINGVDMTVTPTSATLTSTDGTNFIGTAAFQALNGQAPLTWALNSVGSGTLVDFSNGAAEFTPMAGVFGDVQLSVSDAAGQTLTVTVTLEDGSP